MKTFLYFVGKPRDAHMNAVAEDFMRRAGRFASVAMREINPAKFDPFERHPSGRRVFLDPGGKPMDSSAFVAMVRDSEDHGRDLVFVVGGHDGLPPDWRREADILLSLTPMTLPHELARAILAEQIYRAFATLRNHPYPR